MPVHKKVNSSALTVVRYNKDDLTLTIKLKDGNTYKYADVPYDVYLELVNADSKGRYFNMNIRNNFHFERVNPSL